MLCIPEIMLGMYNLKKYNYFTKIECSKKRSIKNLKIKNKDKNMSMQNENKK